MSIILNKINPLDISTNHCLPTFIGIGPGRSGTTTLYESLRGHPDVCMAKNTKEVNYFNQNFQRGTIWYASFFEHCFGAAVRGEISNKYIYDPEVPARMAALLPDVKLVTVLRNPFERFQSVIAYRKRSGEMDLDLTFEEAIENYPDLVTQNFYGHQLERFLNCFPRENLHVAFFDDLKRDPEAFLGDILRFIGVDDSYVPPAIHKRFNARVAPRASHLAALARMVSDTLRQWQLYGLLTRAKRSDLVRTLLFRSAPEGLKEDPEWEAVEPILARHFLPQIAKIESMTGRSLDHWYPDTEG